MTGARTVWLASYPKSGNTWVRALLTALEEGEEIDINRLGHGPIASARGPLHDWLGVPVTDLRMDEAARLRPAADAALDALFTRPQFRKIHDGLFSGPDGAPIVAPGAVRGAVYVARDPRDVAVSFAHHSARGTAEIVEFMGRSANALQVGSDGNAPQLPQKLGTWSEHVAGWLDHDLFDVLLVRYEDLHTEPAHELRRIVEFAGLTATEQAIAGAVRAASFDRLRGQEQERGFNERLRNDDLFFRRGQVCDWCTELPDELAGRIEQDHGAVMQRLGYAIERVPA
jgi:aryl sulfotransferase